MKAARGAFTRLTCLLIAVCFQLRASVEYVSVDSFGFFPSTVEVHPGDTVTWVNLDIDGNEHTTTSFRPILDPDYWNGLLLDYFDTFSHTFNNLGTFDYYDQFDFWIATVKVTPAGAPAGIHLESPRIEGGQFLFDATGLTFGKTNVLEFSTNLTSWTAIQTNWALSTSITFTNPIASARRFFRLVELPN